jgi:hypothetical protein
MTECKGHKECLSVTGLCVICSRCIRHCTLVHHEEGK